MSKVIARAAATADLHTHPAVVAWRYASPDSEPVGVVTLNSTNKSNVFRIHDGSVPGHSLIAKFASDEVVEVERSALQDVIPAAGISGPTYFGSWLADDGHGVWLFMSDVGDRSYDPENVGHRVAGAHWVARLHLATTSRRWPAFPDRHAGYFSDQMDVARSVLAEGLALPGLSEALRSVLNDLSTDFEVLSGLMSAVRNYCDSTPSVLVHGDLLPKNMRVLEAGQLGLEVTSIDWELAGHGPPGLDLARVDRDAYWHDVRQAWPEVSRGDVDILSAIGKVFRLCWAIQWSGYGLYSETPEKDIVALQKYHKHAQQAIVNLDSPMLAEMR